ncbi:MAG TPA: ATP phosphoribosyltransferase [Firmicutes bacterium]|nr:ATP phosphoribosyltransferase [Bacillota bacterium]
MDGLLTIAVPKGRLLTDSLRILELAGFPCSIDDDTRKLMFESGDIRFILTRPGDVPVYVDYGAADVGIVGKDVLMEEGRDVYELLDLGFGFCRFVVAAPRAAAREASIAVSGPGRARGRIRVATKFPRVAEAFFKERGIHAEIIPLRGATELAPQAGLAEIVVDIVSTGRTLAENDLVVISEIGTATARLIANRASFGLKAARIRALVEALRGVLAGEAGSARQVDSKSSAGPGGEGGVPR